MCAAASPPADTSSPTMALRCAQILALLEWNHLRRPMPLTMIHMSKRVRSFIEPQKRIDEAGLVVYWRGP